MNKGSWAFADIKEEEDKEAQREIVFYGRVGLVCICDLRLGIGLFITDCPWESILAIR